jgi:hypothetical protein
MFSGIEGFASFSMPKLLLFKVPKSNLEMNIETRIEMIKNIAEIFNRL